MCIPIGKYQLTPKGGGKKFQIIPKGGKKIFKMTINLGKSVYLWGVTTIYLAIGWI